MFLVERLGASSSFRAELPGRLSYASGDLVRAALKASPPDPSPAPSRRPAIQTELAFPASRQRKAG